ncbi:YgiW/YdeI family stress tolerance OB fold protein [Vibrio amylolyticus]|uniref:YgiW/YdeI family stress tolerance OB fold protein n=1 Tax=Vibrio TaxID=662 RepID=UPI000C82E1E6|nr:NirD/YgiW/YdeI family stress tolerance protein [Vibrio sp. 10N.261.55.A7]PMJ89740.1 hypothetical protein BCU12_13710 [Vibrio sp. 10N.261.55.A7]
MKSKLIALTITATFALASASSFAKSDNHGAYEFQYKGPVEITTVKQITEEASMFKDVDVVVEGQLVKQLSRERFVFSDGTGEVEIELDDINISQAVDQTTTVRLFGEYEGGSKAEIEVDHIVIL